MLRQQTIMSEHIMNNYDKLRRPISGKRHRKEHEIIVMTIIMCWRQKQQRSRKTVTKERQGNGKPKCVKKTEKEPSQYFDQH